MKRLAIILSFAIAGIAVSSEFTSASASRMDGKCCLSSDGGRSLRYQRAMKRAAMRKVAVAPTCSARAASCIRVFSARADRVPMCMTAKAQCLQTGVFVGPYSRWQFAGMHRK
ncbi:MAG: hypothetical protein H0V72_19590 [Bradyrhizobium sp.]|nr:hypothetical protein [Bradyrhizobium sp.]